MRGLYIHVPFCVSKCSYCDFYSLPSRLDLVEPYVQAVLKEDSSVMASETKQSPGGRGNHALRLPRRPDKWVGTPRNDKENSFQTLYIGGGTPSLLGGKHLKALLAGLLGSGSSPLVREDSGEEKRPIVNPPHSSSRPRWGERTGSYFEATIEANPDSTTREFLTTAKESGITRLSFGVQSLAGAELKSVGRIHTASQAIAAIKLAQEIGFQSISADLMIGLPGQTWHSLKNSLTKLADIDIQHLSVYCLSLEEGTPLAQNPPENLPSDEIQAELFDKTRELLTQRGFIHYEISNFALEGFECRHNLNYWHGGEYLGLGPSAASHINGKRFRNKADLDAYLKDPVAQVEYVEELPLKEKAAEEAMLRLRLLQEGLDINELATRFGRDNITALVKRLDAMVDEGLLNRKNTIYRLPPSRVLTSNPIFARVIAES